MHVPVLHKESNFLWSVCKIFEIKNEKITSLQIHKFTNSQIHKSKTKMSDELEEVVYEAHADAEDTSYPVIVCEHHPVKAPCGIELAKYELRQGSGPELVGHFTDMEQVERYLKANEWCASYFREIRTHVRSWLHVRGPFVTKLFTNRTGNAMKEFRRCTQRDGRTEVTISVCEYAEAETAETVVSSLLLIILFS